MYIWASAVSIGPPFRRYTCWGRGVDARLGTRGGQVWGRLGSSVRFNGRKRMHPRPQTDAHTRFGDGLQCARTSSAQGRGGGALKPNSSGTGLGENRTEGGGLKAPPFGAYPLFSL